MVLCTLNNEGRLNLPVNMDALGRPLPAVASLRGRQLRLR
jgi:hypothetical protein